MNFKRILVLLIALIMVVSACAPAISAFNYTETKEKGELVVEDIQNAIDEIVEIVSKNDLQAYAEGYIYALENGYVDASIDAIDNAIAGIEGLDLANAPISSDLKAELENELDACVDTLTNIKTVLENDSVELVILAVIELQNDLDTHIANIDAIYAQTVADLEAADVFENINEALVSVKAVVNTALDGAREYMTDALLPYYDHIAAIVDIDVDVYELLAQVVANAHVALVKTYAYVSNVDNWPEIRNNFVEMMNTYAVVASILTTAYGEIKGAVLVAAQIYKDVIDFVEEYKNDIKDAVAKAYNLYLDIVEAITFAYNTGREAIATAHAIYNYVTDLFARINADVHQALYDAFNASYVLNENSHYVALGGAPYAEELAEMLHLGNKFDRISVDGSYNNALIGADLVTIDFTDDQIYEFAVNQVMGKLASIVRGHSGLMGWYNDEKLVGPYIREALTSYGIDINAEAVELDWSLYLDAEGQAALDDYLDAFKQKIIEEGVPEVYILHFGDVILEAFAQNGYYFPGLTITLDVEIPVADLVVFAVENVIYKHAEFTNRVLDTLENVNTLAPNATVVITGLGNPFVGLVDGLASIGVETQSAELALDVAIGVLNAQLLSNAFIYENVIFVLNDSAEDIFNAIHFTCAHKFDECEDVECNLCGEMREPVAHVFTKYVFNNDSTCTADGTETAVCNNCDKTDTRVKFNSKTGHTYSPATCLAPMTCSCGATLGISAPHTFGEWSVVTEPTDITEGLKEHTCTLCGHVETDTIPVVTPVITVAGIIGIVVLAVAVICGASAGFCYYKKKKNA